MTTIVAYQGEDYAVVGVDSRISSMDEGGFASQIMTLASGSSKVALNGKYLLGAAGDVRAINILHHAFTPPIPTVGMKGKKLDQFMTIKFIPALRECFEKQGYASPERENSVHIAEHDSIILVVVNANIYVVDGDYSWASDASGIYALGTGSAYALGAMHSMLGKDRKSLTPLQAKRYVTKALNIAGKFDPYTGPPFQAYVQEISD
jgi:ATP-dependent protease HslVU (ClpYQ) peptidase subunit